VHSVNATCSGVQLTATCGRTGTESADLVVTHAGDIGDVPAELLGPVLSQCTAQQLAAIEDETRLIGVAVLAALHSHYLPALLSACLASAGLAAGTLARTCSRTGTACWSKSSERPAVWGTATAAAAATAMAASLAATAHGGRRTMPKSGSGPRRSSASGRNASACLSRSVLRSSSGAPR